MLVLNLADTLRKQGRLADAETLLRDCLIHLPAPSVEHPSQELPELGAVLHHLADLLGVKKEFGEARSLAREAATMYLRHVDWSPRERQHALYVLAAIADPGELPAVENLQREALTLTRKQLGDASQVVADLVKDLSAVLQRQGKSEAIVPALNKATLPAR